MSPASRPGVNGALMCIVLLSGLCSCLHQYQLVDELKTWKEAQQYCKERFTDLATVDNMEDMAQLIAAAGSGYSRKVWIGLYDISRMTVFRVSDDGYYGYRFNARMVWAAGEPDSPRNESELCICINKKGQMSDRFCSEQMPFVCYDNTNAPSPATYVYVSQTMTQPEAESYCKSHHSHLTVLRTEEERASIMEAIPLNGLIHTALYRRPWKYWSDDTRRTFKNWLPGHPLGGTGDCAATLIGATNSGKWVEDHCEQKHPFICHYDKKRRFQIKLTALKSTIDLNDPAVREAIQNLMEKKMREKGITAGFRLKWIKKPDNTIFQEEEKDADE